MSPPPNVPLGVAESDVEDLALQHFANLGYAVVHGPNIAPGEAGAERDRYEDVVLRGRLDDALRRLNPGVPREALDEAMRKVLHPAEPSLVSNNRALHKMLRDGVEVDVVGDRGEVRGVRVHLVDWEEPDRNDLLAVNQFTVVEGQVNRRPDVVIFLNGMPVGLMELKNAADENATIQDAFQQVQNYARQIPALFVYNALAVISDGMLARVGTITSSWERFAPWRTIDGNVVAHPGALELSTLLDGVFEKGRFLDLVRNFIVFEDDGAVVQKKLAGYHQFHAVRTAVAETVRATGPGGDRKVGVVWHTQGSGKSLTMTFYAGKVVQEPAMENPTLVVITDRNDLDNQLFGTFSNCHELLRQKPIQAESRDDLMERLDARGEQWVRQGLQYLTEDGACPFCTQDTSGVDLVELFRTFFSEGYREHVVEIEHSLNLVDQALGEQVLHGIQEKVLENDARIRVWADLVDLDYARASLGTFEAVARRLRGVLTEALRQKLANPSAPVMDRQELEAALRDYEEGRADLRRVNQEIARAGDAVASVKKDAAAVEEGKLEQDIRRLRNVQIREQPEAKELCETVLAVRSRKKPLEDEKREKRRELEQLAETALSSHEAAINELLANFGASFRIVETRPSFDGGKASSTYRISIDNIPLDLGDSRTPRGVPCFRTALSAGDKSTLALAFFIARLRRDRGLKSKTVVLDDPLSSLDDFRRSCTSGEVGWIARNAAQVVVFSHDALFLAGAPTTAPSKAWRALSGRAQGRACVRTRPPYFSRSALCVTTARAGGASGLGTGVARRWHARKCPAPRGRTRSIIGDARVPRPSTAGEGPPRPEATPANLWRLPRRAECGWPPTRSSPGTAASRRPRAPRRDPRG